MTLELPKVKLEPQDMAALDCWFKEVLSYVDKTDEFQQNFQEGARREIDSIVQRAFEMGFTYGVNFEKHTKE